MEDQDLSEEGYGTGVEMAISSKRESSDPDNISRFQLFAEANMCVRIAQQVKQRAILAEAYNSRHRDHCHEIVPCWRSEAHENRQKVEVRDLIQSTPLSWIRDMIWQQERRLEVVVVSGVGISSDDKQPPVRNVDGILQVAIMDSQMQRSERRWRRDRGVRWPPSMTAKRFGFKMY